MGADVGDLWLLGDTRARLRELDAGSVHTCVTSPPYWGLRDYGCDGQIGLESTFPEYVATLVDVFREVRRVLRDDGTLWLNLGDCYSGTGRSNATNGNRGASGGGAVPGRWTTGLKPKDLIGIPWRVAFALQDDGWYLRSDIVWHKPNPMPESVTDRPTKAHEYVFLLSRSERYYYDTDAIREPHVTPEDRRASKSGADAMRGQAAIRPRGNMELSESPADRYYSEGGRNRRSVWTVATQPFADAHFATMPPALAEPCILAGSSERGCCATCGAPWERVTARPKRPGVGARNVPTNERDGLTAEPGLERTGMSHFKYAEWLRENPPTTTGWRPTCDHGGEPVPCRVLDPFGGAGTTALVARRNGRRFIHIELNPAYLDIARRRVDGETYQPALFGAA
jgi:DNA modification methylase